MLTNAFSEKQSIPLISYHMWHPSLQLFINPALLSYDQITLFATAVLNSVYKAKCTTKKPPGAHRFAAGSAVSFKTESLRSRAFNWEASEASSWLIVSMIIHLRHSNLQTNV